MSDLVSILIPAYNAEAWIREAIESALDQTWPNKEIIVVDDGSSDRTLQVARSFESKVVNVLTQENHGVCAARNRLLQLAQGDHLQWLDADDIIAPDKIALQLTGAQPGDRSRVLLTAAQGTFFFSSRRARFRPSSLWRDLDKVEWIRTKFSDNVWFNPASWLVSRKLSDLAGPWDDRLSISGDDDGEYICRVVAASDGVHFVKDAKTYYRIGNFGSLNWSRSDESLDALFLALRLSIDHLLCLERSERTRGACRALLQSWLGVFEERDAIVRSVLDLGRELGGELTIPPLKAPYYPLEIMFGRRAAKKANILVSRTKLIAQKQWDRLCYRLQPKEPPCGFTTRRTTLRCKAN